MISSIVSRLVILVFGTLYPAYASYKAVRTKNVKEYVKWMMYWIVFALFTCIETFTDVFFSFWFPFYYEIKVILVLWLLSPATKGSSILYRKFVHPMLTKREQEIDEYISRAKEQGYHTVLTLGTKGVNYATSVIMQTAIKGGGGLVNQLRRSYSLSDISSDIDIIADMNRINKGHPDDQMDHTDASIDPRILRTRGYSTRSPTDMYFPEVDVDVRQRRPRSREPSIPLSQIRSTEDVSSGYSSAEPLYASQPKTEESRDGLVRTSSVGSTRVIRTKPIRASVAVKRAATAEDSVSSDESEETDSQNQEEEFFDVSSTASIPLAIPLPTTLTPTSFKPHPTNCMSDKHSVTVIKEINNFVPIDVCQTEPILPINKLLNNLCDKPSENITAIEETLILSPISEKISPVLTREEIEIIRHAQISRESSLDEVDVTNIVPTRMPVIILPSTNVSVGSVHLNNSIGTELLGQYVGIQTVNLENISQITSPRENIFSEVINEKNKLTKSPSVEDVKENVIEEMEFFDSQEESSTLREDDLSIAGANGGGSCTSPDLISLTNVLAQIKDQDEVLIEQFQMSGDNRAGKYNKRPAPCPPKKTEVELLVPNKDIDVSSFKSETNSSCDSPLIISESTVLLPLETSVWDKKSPSPVKDIPCEPIVVPNGSRDNVLQISCNSKGDRNFLVDDTINDSRSINKKDIFESENVKLEGSSRQSLSNPTSANPQKKKSKENSPFSRLLSNPKSQLSSMFPFWNHDSSRGLVATSLTSLSGDLEEEFRGNSSCSNIVSPTITSKPSVMLPRNISVGDNSQSEGGSSKDAEKSEATKDEGTPFRLREMSHSPPRRQTKLE